MALSPAPSEEKSSETTRHALYLEERKLLIDAARESSRTFDKAVLAFGSAAFGASVAFLKDVVPRPAVDTLSWLQASWLCFSFGVLVILLSFLFSHRACLFEIERAYDAAADLEIAKENRWADATNVCNWASVALFFIGIVLWSHFVLANLTRTENTTMTDQVKKGYVPPPPPKQPIQQPAKQPIQQPAQQPQPQKER